MAIYDYTYKTWSGVRHGAMFRWLALPKYTYMEFMQKKVFIWFFTVSWVPFLLWTLYIYLLANLQFLKSFGIPPENFPPIEPVYFMQFIDVQVMFCFFFCFNLGSGLISRDLKNNAIVLFFSKPISRWEYFLGKFITLFTLLFLITGVQALMLFGLQYFISPAHSRWRLEFWQSYAWAIYAIPLYSTIVCATLTLLILAASSMTKNARYAGVTFAVYIIGAAITAGILAEIIHSAWPYIISPMHTGMELGNYIFRRNLREMLPVSVTRSGVCLQIALATFILNSRLRNAARYGS